MENAAEIPSDVLDSWFELLRIPSIGAEAAHLDDCKKCAEWLRSRLENDGFSAELVGDGTHPPIVFAERPGDESRPVVLVYGHYDVQPPDPLDAWTTPPFEPVLVDGRVRARGANDDKGQSFALLSGIESLIAEGKRLPPLKVIYEGQEENGSTALTRLAPKLGQRIAADVLCVCDTGESPDGRPAIVAGMRGMAHFTLRIRTGDHDLHSGLSGGWSPNAARMMCELLSSLYRADGSIAVEGFEDSVEPPDDATLKILAECVGGSEEDFKRAERVGFHPSIEVNGVHSGYGGPGSKTIIPCEAVAKVSMRLAPGQVPEECSRLVFEHLRARVPEGAELSIEEVNVGTPGFRLATESPVFALAQELLAKLDPRGPVFVWEGASIPVVSELARVSGAAPLLVGFGREGDRIHAPNETYGLDQFARARAWARLFFAR